MEAYNYRAWWVEQYFTTVTRSTGAMSKWLSLLENDGRVTDIIEVDKRATGYTLLARVEGPVEELREIERAAVAANEH